tara:strand:- start:115 stop:315 length:201 start_codon:yes stop_codon:yes gene_type:complete
MSPLFIIRVGLVVNPSIRPVAYAFSTVATSAVSRNIFIVSIIIIHIKKLFERNIQFLTILLKTLLI